MSGSGDGRNAASEAQKDARAVTNQLPPGLTIGEAEAWRAGARHVLEALEACSLIYDDRGGWFVGRRGDSELTDIIAPLRAIAAMEPPA